VKAYKIDLSMYEGKVRDVISEAVQRKAFELGYRRSTGEKIPGHTFAPYLFFNVEKSMTWAGDADRDYFLDHKNTAITPADFLALTTAKDEPTFKPEQLVLVRDDEEGQDDWTLAQFSHMYHDGRFVAMGGFRYDHCIPYEGNEHLLGTTEESK
jgi:hypothetical protein